MDKIKNKAKREKKVLQSKQKKKDISFCSFYGLDKAKGITVKYI